MRMLHFQQNASEISSMQTETKTVLVGEDENAICRSCEIDLKIILCEIVATGWYQCIRYTTARLDHVFPKYQMYITYDGISDGLFCISDKNVFTREVLDSWVLDVCGTRGTFRDTFSSWSA